MLIKITQPGWETYTGELGMAQFVDGVSATQISPAEALRLGACVSVAEIDEAGNEVRQVSPSLDLLTSNVSTAPVERPRKRYSEILEEEARLASEGSESAPKAPVERFTQEGLEKIAEEKGISGLREIADPLGIKGTSIRALITSILMFGQPAETV